MKIKFRKRGKLYRFYIDGASGITTVALARIINRSASSVIRQCEINLDTRDKFQTWVNDVLWLEKEGLPKTTAPFKLDDGSRYCCQMLTERLGCNQSTANARAAKYQDGIFTEKQMFGKVADPKYIPHSKPGPKVGRKRKPPAPKLKMGPRKTIDELPAAGSWEKENLPGDVFCAAGRGRTGVNSSGLYYTG